MIRSGLVSITFRGLPAKEVCRLARGHGLEGIEWGGDVHVPVGELETAKRVAELTREHGLKVAAYGSYYRLGVTEPGEWGRVLETAGALGASIVRVWCGSVGSADADDAVWAAVVDDARRAAAMAEAAGITIACEWHGQTLTDTAASAQRFFDAVDHPALRTYWQPHQKMAAEDCLRDMDTALPRLAGVHVFEWHLETVARLALAEGDAVWPGYLQKLRPAVGEADLYAMIEFVTDDDPANLAADAAALGRWLAAVNG